MGNFSNLFNSNCSSIEYRTRLEIRNWGAYSGLALNDDWKSMQNRISDLAFRICLTQHYGERV